MTARAGTAAILLAGGRASRLGGIDKPMLEVDGRALLQRAVDAVSGCAPVLVVGPARAELDGTVTWVREHPPFAGPAAAIVAALAAAGSPDAAWTFVLAADLVDPASAVAGLAAARAAMPDPGAGLCLADAEGRPQWLTGLYRTTALRRAAEGLADHGVDAPARALLSALHPTVVPASAREIRDIDTWDDALRAGAVLPAATLTSAPTPKETS